MHKELMILGLVGDFGPITGYDLHRIVRAHGDLFTDLKKPNMYYLLNRLEKEGFLRSRATAGARGPRGERLDYTRTPKGTRRFHELLKSEVLRYAPVHTGIEVSVIFLSQLGKREALALLRGRREAVRARLEQVRSALGDVSKRSLLAKISADHLVSLIEAELAWVERSMALLNKSSAPTVDHS